MSAGRRQVTLPAWALALIAVIAVSAIALAGYVAVRHMPTAGHSAAATPSAAPSETPTDTPSATDTPALTEDQIELHIKTLDKQCFGSAGCDISYRIQMELLASPPPDDETYEVTYEVTGDESGPQIGTLTVTGGQYEVQQEETASTSSSATKLHVHVTDVEQTS